MPKDNIIEFPRKPDQNKKITKNVENVTPKQKQEMLTAAQEIKDIIKQIKSIPPVPPEFINAYDDAWYGFSIDDLLQAAKSSEEEMLLTPNYFLSLADTLIRKANGM